MKRFFYAALLLGSSAFAFSSCNNGLYDADVTSTNNGTNPLNGGTGGTGGGGGSTVTPATLGRIKAKVDGKLYDLSASYTALGPLSIFAGSDLSTNDLKFYHLGVTVSNYTGPGTYAIDGSGLNDGSFSYISAQTQVEDSWTTDNLTTNGAGTGTITITEDANNQVKGTFSFTAFRDKPTPSATEKIVVTDGSFYLTK